MNESPVKKIKQYLKPYELVPVVRDCLSTKEISRRLSSSGIVFPGIRMDSLDSSELTLALAEESMAHPGLWRDLEKSLDEACDSEIREARSLSIDELKKSCEAESLADRCEHKRVGHWVWALLRDERRETGPILRSFLDSLYTFLESLDRKAEDLDDLLERLLNDKIHKKDVKVVQKWLARLSEQKNDLQAALESEKKEKDKLRAGESALKEKIRVQNSELAALRRELDGIRLQMNQKETKIVELESKLKNCSEEEAAALRRRAHELERLERKMSHEMLDLNRRLSAAQEDLRQEKESRLAVERQLERALLQKEETERRLAKLSAEWERFKNASAAEKPTPPPPREKGRRLGVFVDTGSLWRLSKAMQKKVDFQKLIQHLILDRLLVKAVAYVPEVPGLDRGPFLRMLSRVGYETRPHNGNLLTEDVLSQAEKLRLDIVHLIGDDAVFLNSARLLKAGGIRTEASGFENRPPTELFGTVDGHIFLGDEICLSTPAKH